MEKAPVATADILKAIFCVCAFILAIITGIELADDPVLVCGLLAITLVGIFLLISKNFFAVLPLWIWFVPWALPLDRFNFVFREIAVPACMLIVIVRSILKLGNFRLSAAKLPIAYWIFAIGLSLLLIQAVWTGGFGLRLMGSSKMGGRTFLGFILAIFIFPILYKGNPSSSQLARALMAFLLLGSFLMAVNQCIDYAFPSLANSNFATIFGLGDEMVELDTTGFGFSSTVRLQRFSALGLALFAVSFFHLRTKEKPVFYIFRSIIACLGIALSMLSGHRLAILTICGWVLIDQLFKSRKKFFISITLVALTTILLVGGNNYLFRLPIVMQRSLAFLPGNWDLAATQDAEGSTKWRLEIWDQALPIIRQNIFFGRGLTFDIDDVWNSFIKGDQSGKVIFTNVLHNGPLSILLAFGLTGLFFSISLSGYVCYRAIYLRNKFKKAPSSHWKGFLDWITTDILLNTIVFYFIFGGHNNFAWQVFLGWGILELTARQVTLLQDSMTANEITKSK